MTCSLKCKNHPECLNTADEWGDGYCDACSEERAIEQRRAECARDCCFPDTSCAMGWFDKSDCEFHGERGEDE